MVDQVSGPQGVSHPSCRLLVAALLVAAGRAEADELIKPVFTSNPPPLVTIPEDDSEFGYHSPVRVRAHFGETYSARDSFFTAELFKTLGNLRFANGNEAITYFDGRVGGTSNGIAGSESRSGASSIHGFVGNFGFGAREYIAISNAIVDGNIWYDADATQGALFHQLTAGAKVQSRVASVRGHYYYPISELTKSAGYTPLTGNYAFGGRNIQLERYRIIQTVLKGFDLEIGCTLPHPEHECRLFGGYYHFSSDRTTFDRIQGVSGRFEIDLWPGITLGTFVNYGNRNDFNILTTLTMEFFNGLKSSGDSIRYRLGESVRRNYNVVAASSLVYDPLAATDAAGNTIEIVHASSSGAGAPDGSAENPYNNLAAAAADAAANSNVDRIFVHAGSTFIGQSVVVPEDHQLLGEGESYMVDTAQLGTITLPRATMSTIDPIIRDAPGNAITLSNGATVNNFTIRNATGSGVAGDGLTQATSVTNITVDGATNGIDVRNSSNGPFTFESLSINNTTGNGIHLEANAENTTFEFGTTAIANTGGDGIHLANNAAGAIFTGTTIDFNGATTIDNPTGDGVEISDGAPNVTFQTLEITNWNSRAIHLLRTDGVNTFAQPLVLDNVNGSLGETIRLEGNTRTTTFSNVTITDTSRAALGTASVNLVDNSTGVDIISFASLDVTTNNGGAIASTNTGLLNSQVHIAAGVLNTSGAPAVSFDSLGATDITLQSVSATNTNVGIELVDFGFSAFHDKFLVAGDGVTPGSGGTIVAMQHGVLSTNSENVQLNFLQIDSTLSGVTATDSDGFVANGLTLNSTSDNWVGIDAQVGGAGFYVGDAISVTNNTISGSGMNQIGLNLFNDGDLHAMPVTVGGNDINLTGAGAIGMNIVSDGNGSTLLDLGEIILTPAGDNTSVAAQPFMLIEQNNGDISGQVLINGLPRL